MFIEDFVAYLRSEQERQRDFDEVRVWRHEIVHDLAARGLVRKDAVGRMSRHDLADVDTFLDRLVAAGEVQYEPYGSQMYRLPVNRPIRLSK